MPLRRRHQIIRCGALLPTADCGRTHPLDQEPMVQPGFTVDVDVPRRDEPRQPGIGVHADLPLRLRISSGVRFDEAMVVRAEEDPVRQAGDATSPPWLVVVSFTRRRWRVATGKGTALVPRHQRGPNRLCEEPVSATDVQRLGRPTQDDRGDVGIARQSPRFGGGESLPRTQDDLAPRPEMRVSRSRDTNTCGRSPLRADSCPEVALMPHQRTNASARRAERSGTSRVSSYDSADGITASN